MKVLVIGGGIGGFATALSLHAVGIECEVFEQSRGIRELGVGINTLPHAIKELAQLGHPERAWRAEDTKGVVHMEMHSVEVPVAPGMSLF